MNDRFQIVGARPLPEAAPTKNRHSLRGEPVATTPSAAMVLAMLRHTAASRHAHGIATKLSVSKALDAAASVEAQAEGRTLVEHLDWLEAERRTRNAPPEPPASTH